MSRHMYRELEAELHTAGFRRTRTKNHHIWKHPTGPMVVLTGSPGDQRSYWNDRAIVRRVI